jgi:hypothetical protein
LNGHRVVFHIGAGMVEYAHLTVAYLGMAFGTYKKCGRCAFRNDSQPLSLVNCLAEMPRPERIATFCLSSITC